tara:strand:+ start:176 stop:421 length:246 start_codon:yes stop_codon:yes gene_type:complete
VVAPLAALTITEEDFVVRCVLTTLAFSTNNISGVFFGNSLLLPRCVSHIHTLGRRMSMLFSPLLRRTASQADGGLSDTQNL